MSLRPLIILTNDDGINSPGLAASAAALDPLGDLLIVAPSVQQSGMGRSLPSSNDGRLFEATVRHNGQSWPGYGANASPAQAVLHGLLELADRTPALVVSGINYGENIGTGITASGTVGAALEAAAHEIRALAISLETDLSQHMTNDPTVDFSTAMYFTRLFAQMWLKADPLPDVDVLKIDIPALATPQTPWHITRLQQGRYFVNVAPVRKQLGDEGRIGYIIDPRGPLDHDTDARVLADGLVSVTPLSLDITSRIAPSNLLRALEEEETETT